MTYSFAIALILTFLLTVLAERWLIPKLKSWKMGQTILEIGPRWHKSKDGTPTMGGLAFIAAASAAFLAICLPVMLKAQADGMITGKQTVAFVATYLLALCNGAVGVFDDLQKFRKKQNEGLSAGQKYLLQLALAIAYVVTLAFSGNITTAMPIPFFGVSWDLGIFTYVIYVILITGIVNSVNLTDGIDGLASTVTAVAAAFFAVAGFAMGNMPTALLSGIGVGACLGFLVYNFYPARVFMGDTGSLFLGGLIVGAAFLIGQPLIILPVGIIYLCESGSVILQVASFKLTGKRIFKMSPIHHHFEMCGWNEVKIVAIFSLVTVLFAVLSWFGLA